MHTITITIPVYERYEYFEEALDSALNQTVKCPIIIIDNDSHHDKFKTLVESKASLYTESLKYVRNERNLGLFGNWNRCAELVETSFFIILSDDDILHPMYIEGFYNTILKYPDLDFYYTALDRFGSAFNSHPTQKIRFGSFAGIEAVKDAAIYGLCWPTNSTCYRTSILNKTHWLNPSSIRHAQSDWMFIYTNLIDKKCFGNSNSHYRLRVHDNNSGKENVIYTILTRSKIFFEIAEQSLQLLDHKIALNAYRLSATQVLNAFLLDPKFFQNVINDSLEDSDPFIQFIVDTWARYSFTIRYLIEGKSLILRKVLWIICRLARFLSRYDPYLFNNLATGKFSHKKKLAQFGFQVDV